MTMSGTEMPVVAAAAASKSKRYAIDVRLFVFTITTAMAASFYVGVMFGPTPEMPLFNETSPLASILPNDGDDWQEIKTRSVKMDPPVERLQKQMTEDHQPAGQHLLVDIKNVESAFLDSEERLAAAMVEAVKAVGLTMLSYHCHKLHPEGVSCVGVLLESHISFHTWPGDGVITLDLFTCGNIPLIVPAIPKLEELFGVGGNPVTQWSHELRGFRETPDIKVPYHLDNDSDLGVWVYSPLAEAKIKRNVVTVKSPYQQIDIWDILEVEDTPSHEDAKRHNLQEGDPRYTTPEIATPDRLLFLDGTLQVRLLLF